MYFYPSTDSKNNCRYYRRKGPRYPRYCDTNLMKSSLAVPRNQLLPLSLSYPLPVATPSTSPICKTTSNHPLSSPESLVPSPNGYLDPLTSAGLHVWLRYFVFHTSSPPLARECRSARVQESRGLCVNCTSGIPPPPHSPINLLRSFPPSDYFLTVSMWNIVLDLGFPVFLCSGF